MQITDIKGPQLPSAGRRFLRKFGLGFLIGVGVGVGVGVLLSWNHTIPYLGQGLADGYVRPTLIALGYLAGIGLLVGIFVGTTWSRRPRDATGHRSIHVRQSQRARP